MQEVVINNVTIHVDHFYHEKVTNNTENDTLHKIGLGFKVSSKNYHEITTLLYENDFEVKVPGKRLDFPATILSYSTSITNLYKDNAVGDFKLELIERK